MTIDETARRLKQRVEEPGINLMWPFEANSTTVHDLKVPSVNSLSSSVMVCSHFHWRKVLDSLNPNLIGRTWCNMGNPSVSVHSIYRFVHKQASGIHTHFECSLYYCSGSPQLCAIDISHVTG